MAIKYVVIPEKKITIGILENTEFDAIYQIQKKFEDTPFIFAYEKYLMPDRFKTVTVCHSDDEYSIEEGKRAVKEKLLKNYHKSLDKKLNRYENVFIDENSEF